MILYPSPLAPFFGNEEDLKLRCKLEWPKLRWEGCQGVSTAAVLRQTCSKLKLDSGSSSETPMIPMTYVQF